MMGTTTILGAGEWGTALACTFSHASSEQAPQALRLWGRNAKAMRELQKTRVNRRYLPEARLPALVECHSDCAQAVEGARHVFVAVPAQQIASFLSSLTLPSSLETLVCCAKGIESSSGRFLSEIFHTHFSHIPFAVLSGPGFGREVAAGLPYAATLACREEGRVLSLCRALSHRRLRLYAESDTRGVEIGGACKNVLAIACGIASGRALGEGLRAALITRGLAEIARFARVCGAKERTLSGLSGVGDAILTCSSEKSRNFAFGRAIGSGKSVASLLSSPQTTIEGVGTARAFFKRREAQFLDLPIMTCIAKILEDKISVEEVLDQLFARPIKTEHS